MTYNLQELRILIVDFLDSYTYNIPSWLRTCTRSTLTFDVVPYDRLKLADVGLLAHKFDGIILSAGPGTVDNPRDLGEFTPFVLQHGADLPILGICLGFQAICKAFGGTIKRLRTPHHGIISDLIDADGRWLRRSATRYHSLEASLDKNALVALEVLAYAQNVDMWGKTTAELSLMEIRHRQRPIWGVQYHPESVCSKNCEIIAQPFLEMAARRSAARSQDWTRTVAVDPSPMVLPLEAPLPTASIPQKVLWEKLDFSIDLLEILRRSKPERLNDFVLLESASKGDWSILSAAETASSFRYCLRRKRYTLSAYKDSFKYSEARDVSLEGAWQFLQAYTCRRRYVGGPAGVPFWGGWLGYFSYELGLEQLGLQPYPLNVRDAATDHEDFHLIWSTETIVQNKTTNSIYLISINGDQGWMRQTKTLIQSTAVSPSAPLVVPTFNPSIISPDHQDYIERIEQCQDSIRAGDSYEICLTATSRLCPRHEASAVDFFALLRSRNPAEFMSLMRLGRIEVVSASPEEFLSFDADKGRAEMKPIKGTLSKVDADGVQVTLDKARTELQTPKATAENLMIVDLIRNDLSKVSDNVSCANLFYVEELSTMYQLISHVTAEVRPGVTIWELLGATLPPGSMTGAPKHRSCRILQDLESESRGIYSGVIGYIDVRGHSRTSVSIRNAVRYPREDSWRIGAGGAITNLSDAEGEWAERALKASSICRALQPGFEILETILWNPLDGLRFWDQHMERLNKAITYFGFEAPSAACVFAEGRKAQLKRWVENELLSSNTNCAQRISLTVSATGNPRMTMVPIEARPMGSKIKVYLDPRTTDATILQPFIVHKTTMRAHYAAARERTAAQGLDEALLFIRDPTRSQLTTDPANDDVLTEGSYSNIAIFDTKSRLWITPRNNCLPGIERERLLANGEIIPGDIRRGQLVKGSRVLLFNSVRGRFEGEIQ